ncbi:MAG: peptidase MA family metallohydrolase [Anaerolineae bacterium]
MNQKFLRVFTILIVLVLCLFPLGGVNAQGTITVQTSEAQYVFSQELDFSLKASGNSPIVKVILFYGIQDEPLVRRIYPTFSSGKTITVSYTEQVESGQFAPGTTLRYYWQLLSQDGTSFRTEQQSFEYTDTNHTWQKIAGDRVDLYWYGNKGSLANDLATKADNDALTLEGRYGTSLSKRPQIYVYNSTTDMSKALTSRSEGYDAAVTTLGVTVNETTLLLLGSHRDVRYTLSHELSHLVLGMATDNPFTGLPRWLDEGLAMYAEGDLRSQNQAALDEGIRSNSLLTIRSMSSYSGLASQVDMFYGEAYSIVDFMIRDLGEDKLKQLLNVMAGGVRQEDALQQVYGFGLDELDRRWRASIGAQPAPTPKPTKTTFLQVPIENGLVINSPYMQPVTN